MAFRKRHGLPFLKPAKHLQVNMRRVPSDIRAEHVGNLIRQRMSMMEAASCWDCIEREEGNSIHLPSRVH